MLAVGTSRLSSSFGGPTDETWKRLVVEVAISSNSRSKIMHEPEMKLKHSLYASDGTTTEEEARETRESLKRMHFNKELPLATISKINLGCPWKHVHCQLAYTSNYQLMSYLCPQGTSGNVRGNPGTQFFFRFAQNLAKSCESCGNVLRLLKLIKNYANKR